MLVDLDDTLYQDPEIPRLVLSGIKDYMCTELGVAEDRVDQLAYDYYINSGTTMAGLVADGHHVDYDDWHSKVHHFLPYEELLKPDPQLKDLLTGIPLRKWIFTNADTKHAEICLRIMGLTDCFEGVISFESLMETAARTGLIKDRNSGPVICKPNKEAFRLALEAANMKASETLFLDDSVRNVTSAREYGIFSILVKPGDGHWSGPTISSLHDLPTAQPQLWESIDKAATVPLA